jgi:hypothetical protein
MKAYTLGFLLAVSCSCGIAATYDFFFVKPPTAAIAPFGVQLGCAAISNSGEAVGNFIGSDHRSHGLLVKADGTAMVIDAPNLPQTALAGVNSAGWIVGSDNNFSQGFLLAPDLKQFTPLAIPAGSPDGRYSPMSINDLGDVVGILAGPDGTYHGWLLSGGLLTIIDYPGSNGTQFTGVNNNARPSGCSSHTTRRGMRSSGAPREHTL